jgi:hypothetical protein
MKISAIKVSQFSQKHCCPKSSAKFKTKKFEVFCIKSSVMQKYVPTMKEAYEVWIKIKKPPAVAVQCNTL